MTDTEPNPMKSAPLSSSSEPMAAPEAGGESGQSAGTKEPKRSHKGITIEFRVFPEEAAMLKERAAEASMTVSEFCRRATSGKRIVSRYDYDVMRRLVELHGDQARLGNLLKMAVDQDRGRFGAVSVTSLIVQLAENQERLARVIQEVADA